MKDNKDDKLDNKKRKIEFRGKSKFDKNHKWVYGDLIQGENAYISTEEEFYAAVVSLGGHLSTFVELVDKDTIGQFTGLCDKNGKKIYEGDIIKSHYGSIYIVKYFADWSGFSLKLVFLNTEGKLNRATGRQHLYKNDCTRLEILGNVWDNPELLGG